MKRAPPYYKETAAWMKGMECARIYSDSSKFPIQCVTDHTPLTYVKNTSGKGPVSQFILDNLSYLDYTITYRPGKKLVEADSVSRFPCLGPLELSPDGVKEAFDVLLAAIPEEWNTKKRVWINAQKETELIQQMVRQWMSTLPSISSKTGRYPTKPTASAGAQFTFITCMSHVHHMCTWCKLHVRHMCLVCASHVKHMCFVCGSYVSCMCFACKPADRSGPHFLISCWWPRSPRTDS